MLVETSDSFSIKWLKLESRVDDHVSINTIIRILQHNSYYYLNHEWKIWCQGMMAEHDHFLKKKWNILFAGTFGPMVSEIFSMESQEITKLVHVI